MPGAGQPSHGQGSGEVRPEDLGHPRGTLAIVVIFGLAFGLAWFAMYVFQFLGRGAPHP
jgi:hypothetical protein